MTKFSFTWDEQENRQNQKRHGVSFEEAQSVFFDDAAREFFDPDHSEAIKERDHEERIRSD